MASFESYEATFLQVTAGINTRISELGTYTSDYGAARGRGTALPEITVLTSWAVVCAADAAMGAIKKLETDLKEAKQSVRTRSSEHCPL